MKTNILTIILVIAVLVFGYVGYGYFKPAPALSVEKTSSVAGSSTETRALLDALSIMQGLRIDTGFFNSPVYKNLKDLSPEVSIPSVRGRTNPFLPLQ
ncbi:MAG: hypothetical protein HZC14_03125 [Candidatus Niyogibacteria bacterium]|nr:hypothetical protein [Candidatus Niyogibacteria bacterium]